MNTDPKIMMFPIIMIGGRSSLSPSKSMVTPPITSAIIAIAQYWIVRNDFIVSLLMVEPNTLNVCASTTKNGIDAM